MTNVNIDYLKELSRKLQDLTLTISTNDSNRCKEEWIQCFASILPRPLINLSGIEIGNTRLGYLMVNKSGNELLIVHGDINTVENLMDAVSEDRAIELETAAQDLTTMKFNLGALDTIYVTALEDLSTRFIELTQTLDRKLFEKREHDRLVALNKKLEYVLS